VSPLVTHEPAETPAGSPPASRVTEPISPWARRRGRITLPSGAEIALAGVTAAAVVGMARLFSDGSFLAPLLLVVVASHGLALVLRRLGVNLLLAALFSGLGLLLVLGWVVEPGSLTFGLPLGQTWQAIQADLADASEQFGRVRAPTPAATGFVLACAVATWVAAFAADTFAFRARARFESLVPSFVVFLFGAVLGANRFRLTSAVVYLAAVLIFAVLGDPARNSSRAWFAGRSGSGNRALLRAGGSAALVAVFAALIVGPRLPGADDPGVVTLNDAGSGSQSRKTMSPLVDIKSRLVEQSNTEMFTVSSEEESYWRLTSLERFDGSTWSPVGSYELAQGRLPSGASRSRVETVVQQFEVGALASPWLPAAYLPQRLDGVEGVRFDSDSASLLTDEETSDNLRYSVESALPRITAADLAAATPALSPAQRRRYLDLPDDFPASVTAAARQVTAADAAKCQSLGCSPEEASIGRLSPYHQARALQDWFRSEFEYSLEVQGGHGDDAIEEFLSVRRGYCEQFAGTFAAMARSLGLPSRVAVGFTPGTRGADGLYRVTGREAHAWPEVYLAPTGWVPFEPTPGRSIPGGEAYTGVEASPATPAGLEAIAPLDVTPSTVAGPPGAAAPTTAPTADSPAPPSAASGTSGWRSTVARMVALLAVVAYLAGVPLAHRLRRSRRRDRATNPTARVLLAWTEAEEDMARAGLAPRPAETAGEYADRASGGTEPATGTALVELAGEVSTAAYSPLGADEHAAARAETAAAAVRSAVSDDLGPVRTALWSLDPRPLLAAGTRSLRSTIPRA